MSLFGGCPSIAANLQIDAVRCVGNGTTDTANIRYTGSTPVTPAQSFNN